MNESPITPVRSYSKARWGRTALVAIVIVLLIAGGWWFYRSRTTTTEIAPGEFLTTAPQGVIVDGFPKDLILEKDALVTKSYSVEYKEGGVAQPVVSYISNKSVRDNIQAFRVYLIGQGWTLIREGNSSELPATSIYAAKDNAQTNITLAPLPEGKTQVTISYVVKG